MKQSGPLVSVCIITYNTSKYVLETLESVRRQTYQNIELIISDDGSSDDTIEVCNRWISEHSQRFIRTNILTVPINTGLTANVNRAYSEAKGQWVKVIGDDILLENAITDYVDYVNIHPDIQILFARAQLFRTIKGKRKNIMIKPEACHIPLYNLSPFDQFNYLLEVNAVAAPTTFMKKELFDKYRFDERFKFLDDYPMWLKLTLNGVKLNLLNKITVLYRMSDSSLSKTHSTFYSPMTVEALAIFYYLQKKDYLIKYRRDLLDAERKSLLLRELVVLFFNNKRNLISRIGYRGLKLFLGLFRYNDRDF